MIKNRFYQAIQGKNKISVIAEVKKSSPSHGPFKKHSVDVLVRAYEHGGASAISVVTEPLRFGGSLDLLRQIRSMTDLPILRKDFVRSLDEIDATVQAGADSLLLIANILEREQLEQLTKYAHDKGLNTVIELHDEDDLAKIINVPNVPEVIIGINNRDLKTFKTDVRHALSLIDRVNPSRTIIAESAFAEAINMRPYLGKVDAFLIGTALLEAENPLEKLQSFIVDTPQLAAGRVSRACSKVVSKPFIQFLL